MARQAGKLELWLDDCIDWWYFHSQDGPTPFDEFMAELVGWLQKVVASGWKKVQ